MLCALCLAAALLEGSQTIEAASQASVTATETAPSASTACDCSSEKGSDLVAQERACAQRDGAACRALGRRFASGNGVARDEHKALSLFQKACDVDDAQGCREYGQNACEKGGLSVSANELVQTTIPSESRGKSDRPSSLYLEKAARILVRECTGGDAIACQAAVSLYDSGERVARDPEKALQTFRNVASALAARCGEGEADDCLRLAVLYHDRNGAGHDDAEAARYFSRANALNRAKCDRGIGGACLALRDSCRGGRGLPMDLRRADRLTEQGRKLLRNVCASGDADACAILDQELNPALEVPIEP